MGADIDPDDMGPVELLAWIASALVITGICGLIWAPIALWRTIMTGGAAFRRRHK